jgi:formylglycine-generating enzyme required for sulfatase activity
LPFHYGKSLSSTQANFYGIAPYGDGEPGPYLERTCKVGSYKPNAFGLYDMHGNVWEWCQDWYSSTAYADRVAALANEPDEPDSGDGPAEGHGRVNRGSSWYDPSRNCRLAERNSSDPPSRCRDLGFRPVMNPQGSPVCSGRVFRGGSWCLGGRYCRSAFRSFAVPTYRGNSWGFRPVMNPPSPQTGTARVLRGGSLYAAADSCRASYRFWFAPGSRFSSYFGLRPACALVAA